jgi:hypothetical protein
MKYLLPISLVVLATLAWCPPAQAQPQVRVGLFRPSTHGLHFVNSFDSMPHIVIPFPTGPLAIGDAANGMCGGMVYAVRDYFEAGLPIPSQTTAPGSNSFLYTYLTIRLYDSFDIPVGPIRYLNLMSPGMYDGGVTHPGRFYFMVTEEWPLVKANLDAGILSPLGLIRVITPDMLEMGKNHQALAYGYTSSGTVVRIYLYDPNHPDDDNVVLQFDAADPYSPSDVTYTSSTVSQPSEQTFSFFRTNYRFVSPIGGVHVDRSSPCLFPDGAPNCGALPGGPFHTVKDGANFANPGVLLMIKAGSYPETGNYTKSSTYRSWSGPVTIGR